MLSKKMKQKLISFLKEDLGKGDVTSAVLKPEMCTATIVLEENALVAGTEEAAFLFRKHGIKVINKISDGRRYKKGTTALKLRGSNKKMLAVERTALNVMGRMTSVATACTDAKKIIGKTKPCIAITRKTEPGFREFDKKAAEVAGVWPHRMDLNEFILLKDNHLKFFSNAGEAVIAAKKKNKSRRKIEVEVETEAEAISAARAKPSMIMLDNFSPVRAKKAIAKIRKICVCKIELSGGITLKNLKKYKNFDADIISMGSLTYYPKRINFGLRVKAK